MAQTFTSIIRSPHFLLVFFGVLLALSWHFSILFVSPFSWLENRSQVERLLVYYTVFHTALLFVSSIWARSLPALRHASTAIVAGYGGYLTIRALDWNVLYYYGGHVDALFWDNAFYASSASMLVTKVAFLSTLGVAVALILFNALVTRIFQHSRRHIGQLSLFKYLAFYCIAPPLFALTLLLPLIHTVFFPQSDSNVYTRLPPEFHVAQSVYDFITQGQANNVVLNQAQKDKLATMGIKLEAASTKYPLFRDSIYINAVDRAEPRPKKPNIIIVMVESLSSFFIEDPSVRELGITPNLDSFRSESIYFDNIINAATPTLQGQIAVLASSLHLFKTSMNLAVWGGHKDVDEQDSNKKGAFTTRYPYLSLLLKEHGYQSTHIQSGRAGFAGTEHQFRFSAKYDDFISAADRSFIDQRRYPLGHWGASDIDTFNLVSRWLDSQQNKPFFLSISTIDIHHPYIPVVTKPGVQNNLLNTVYSTDVGFGFFWDYFKNSKLKDNTIVVVTADHALFPTAEYLNIRQADVGYYDKIPLMIYSPFHTTVLGTVDKVQGSQLDIAPTVLELLGIDLPNAFMGLSLLSDRKNYPHLIGKVNLASRLGARGSLHWSDDEQTLLVNYLRYLASRNKLYPPDASLNTSASDLYAE